MKKRIFITLTLVFAIALSIVPVASAAEFTFTDVPTSHRHRLAVEYAAKYEFVRGLNAATFDPEGVLTREQFALIWARTLPSRMHKFNDVMRVPTESDNAIILMHALGHVNGVSESEFQKTTHVTREQAAAIAYRAYLPGNDSKKAEEAYTDHASISSWAKNAVGVLRRDGLLDNVFTGPTFQPQRAITRSEVCQLIYNIMKVKYDVKIADMTNGTVETDKAKASPGETVTLTVKPAEGFRIVHNSLKVNGNTIAGTTFTMPLRDVTVTAEFEAIRDLVSIAITTLPTKLTYTYGQPLDLSGMVVTATYAAGPTAVVTALTTSTPANGSPLLLAPGLHKVTIYYTEGLVTRDAEFNISMA
jgi:hypothetical protein